jgi:hypothetical protein
MCSSTSHACYAIMAPGGRTSFVVVPKRKGDGTYGFANSPYPTLSFNVTAQVRALKNTTTPIA